MSRRSLLFVANWKMQLSFDETVRLCEKHKSDLDSLDASGDHQIVLCPSFPALYPVQKSLQGTSMALGAQTCSNYASGAYTGEISAQSLAQVGCSFCIVGHSERRIYFHETNEDVAEKVAQLAAYDIKPIICVGEDRETVDPQKAIAAIAEQLKPIFARIKKLKQVPPTIIIAYEPVWAIGTGRVPAPDRVDEILRALAERCSFELPTGVAYLLLYGGSVKEETIAPFAVLDSVNGFLIGGASLDFQKFRNMISLCS